MPTITLKESSAGSAVGTNLMTGSRGQIAGYPRQITHIGVAGSTNPGDFSVDLYAGDVYLGTFFNTTGGANVIPKPDADFVPVGSGFIAPGVPINVLISDAGAGNISVVTLNIEARPMPNRRY